MSKHRVIIVGAGFGGLNAAQQLKNADVDLLVIDKMNHHLFQPLLYQVATAALSPADIAAPIRVILAKQANCTVLMANVVKIDKTKRELEVASGERFPYDYLILSPGARHSYFGHSEWEKDARGLKTLDDALHIREKILMSFELAERCKDHALAAKYLRFVIVGGGPTGVEMAGAIAEIARKSLIRNFRYIKPEHSEIYLIEGEGQVLPSYPKRLAEIALHDLEQMGVRVLLNTKVSGVIEEGVWLGRQFLESPNIIWAAGNQASPLLQTLQIPLDKAGRIPVAADLSLKDHPEIFVIGDAALVLDEQGRPLPGIAPVAIQQGRYVGKLLRNKDRTKEPFSYFDKGSLATIGRAKAVGLIGKKQVSGYIAWLAWSLIHILYLISFPNRLSVLLHWCFLYITHLRPVRLIIKPIDS